MTLLDYMRARIRTLDPGCFALVMATGIVSIDAQQHAMPRLARALLALNIVAYAVLLVLTGLRIASAWRELRADFTNPARGAGFLTFAAGSCVLASQCLLVVSWPTWAGILTVAGAIGWAVVLYLFLLAVITAENKPEFAQGINGGWLVVVVATQGLAVALTLLVANGGTAFTGFWLFIALCLFMVGDALYLILITLIAYRLLFLSLTPRQFSAPYWINMGALAITTLAGGLLIVHIPQQHALADLVPFVKGFTLFFWATATWWVPLLLALEIWRRVRHHQPWRYEVADWNIVFPLGMYTAGTYTLGRVLGLDLLQTAPATGVYISLLAWALVALGALLRRSGALTPAGRDRHLE